MCPRILPVASTAQALATAMLHLLLLGKRQQGRHVRGHAQFLRFKAGGRLPPLRGHGRAGRKCGLIRLAARTTAGQIDPGCWPREITPSAANRQPWYLLR